MQRGTWLMLVGLLGCVDRPVCLTPRGGTQPAQRLSEFGLFRDLRQQVPAPGVVPYDVAVTLYADHASKRRFLSVPPGQQLHATDDRWVLPEGTLLVKTFVFPLDAHDPGKGEQRVETRLLQQTDHGLLAATYVWNDAQTDATCSGGNLDVPVSWVDGAEVRRTEDFHVPGTSRCLTCHGDGADSHAAGLRNRQMNLREAYDDGTQRQVDHLVKLGLLDAAPPDDPPLADPLGDAPLDVRAQSYLDVNCGSCHQDRGYAQSTGILWDLGHALQNVCKPAKAIDGSDGFAIVPGHPERSAMIARMRSADPALRMPQGATHLPDTEGIDVVARWIASLPAQGCAP